MLNSSIKKSVFMIINGDKKDGLPFYPTFVRTQAKSVEDCGWDVSMGVIDDRTSVQGILRNVRIHKQNIAQGSPGLVHAQYGSVTAAVGCFIKGRLPLVISFCGDDLLGTPSSGLAWRVREKISRFIGLWAAERASAIIVKSTNLLNALPYKLRNKTTILPNGVDMDFFRPMDKSEARQKLGWSQSLKIVLFNPSKNEDAYRKNPALAHNAIHFLSRDVPHVLIKMLDNSSIEEVRLMMNAADCLLVTSLQEGSPNIVKEAMSCNLPVVSVPCGDVEERLDAVSPGSICSYDARVLADAIKDVFSFEHRSNGRERLIGQRLDLSDVAERLIQIYQHVQIERANVIQKVDSNLCAE